MDSIAKLHFPSQPSHFSLNPHRPSFSKPIFSLSFRTPPPLSSSSPPFNFSSIRVSSSRASLYKTSQTPQPSLLQTLNPLLKTTCITLTCAAAILFLRLQAKPAIAAPVAEPATVEPTKESSKENVSYEEQERDLEQHLARHPDDTEALRSLMEVRIKARKLLGAIEVVDRLIELEPNEDEWPLLKPQIYSYSGEFELARKGFEEILEKDPLWVEAYHGLVMIYEELVKEEPRDFRPYLCQGIIYTLLRKKDEAEKKFEQFRKLVPKNHPYREFFLDNMFSTKFFSGRSKGGSRVEYLREMGK
ncbi:hypothetical protein GH714_012810 [Hevea brasiliensis]|uniref:Chloroplast lumen common family protein n=1 Tax=Hevea brasiliensis TaxID=3981 RepID=A0A6A6LXD1_HEVBR|nr:hypothetical protein GH714_012810 [Hevea brasiliensis]